MKNYFLAMICFLALGFSPSCSDEKKAENCVQDYTNDIQNELSAISAAATAYGTNPTTANCNALKAAYQDYIDVAQGYANCSGFSASDRAAYEQQLQDAEDSIATIC